MDRAGIERGLEGFVLDNRFTIAVVVPLVGAVVLVASAEGRLPLVVAFAPLLLLAGTVVMRLPLLVGLLPIVDRRVGLIGLGAVAYVYAIEATGLATGWPYGEFSYGIDLGPMVGGVPLGLPLFFLPLVVDAYLFAVVVLGPRSRRRAVRVPAAIATVLAVDLVLDPAAVALGFWAYADGGAYYGVPASNFAGWLLSAAVVVTAIEAAFPVERLLDRLDSCEFVLDDLVSFVLLWGVVNAAYGHWVPVAITLAVAFALYRADRLGPLAGRSGPASSRDRAWGRPRWDRE